MPSPEPDRDTALDPLADRDRPDALVGLVVLLDWVDLVALTALPAFAGVPGRVAPDALRDPPPAREPPAGADALGEGPSTKGLRLDLTLRRIGTPGSSKLSRRAWTR